MFNNLDLAINEVYKQFNGKTTSEHLILMSKQIFNLLSCMYVEPLVDVPEINFMELDTVDTQLNPERMFYNDLFEELQRCEQSTDTKLTMKERKQFIKVRRYQFYVYVNSQIGNLRVNNDNTDMELQSIFHKIRYWKTF